jgi:WD40 repeat protein
VAERVVARVIEAIFLPMSDTAAVLISPSQANKYEQAIKLFEVNSCEAQQSPGLPKGDNTMIIRADSKARRMVWGDKFGAIHFYDLEKGRVAEKMQLPTKKPIIDMDIDARGRYLAAGLDNGEMFILDLQSKKIQPLKKLPQYVNTVKFSHDGKYLAAAGKADHIFVWRSEDSFKSAPSLLSLPGGTNRLAFSSDDHFLAAGADELYISGWRVGTWQLDFLLYEGVGIRSVFDFHPHRSELAFDGRNGVLRGMTYAEDKRSASSHGVVEGVEVRFPRQTSSQSVTEVQPKHSPKTCS